MTQTLIGPAHATNPHLWLSPSVALLNQIRSLHRHSKYQLRLGVIHPVQLNEVSIAMFQRAIKHHPSDAKPVPVVLPGTRRDSDGTARQESLGAEESATRAAYRGYDRGSASHSA